MNRIIKIVSLLISGYLGTYPLIGQEPTWAITPASYQYTIFIYPVSMDTSIFTIENGDVIAAFYKSNGSEYCGGKLTWGTNNHFSAYRNDSISTDNILDTTFHFKIWKQQRNCIIDNVQADYNSTSLANSNDSIIINNFSGNLLHVGYSLDTYCDNEGIISPSRTNALYDIGYSSIDYFVDSLNGEINLNSSYSGTMNISFTSDYCLERNTQTLTIIASPEITIEQNLEICENESKESAIDSYLIDNIDSTGNLNIDTLIFISDNSYFTRITRDVCSTIDTVEFTVFPQPTIEIETEYLCDATRLTILSPENEIMWNDNSISATRDISTDRELWIKTTSNNGCTDIDTVDVKVYKMEITNLDITSYDADCYSLGEIRLRNQSIMNNIGEPVYYFKNKITGEVSDSFSRLREGKYQIFVKDSRHCEAIWKDEVTILKDCLNDDPVFSPDSDGRDDDYFISFEGTVQIFDKNGNLRYQFEGPGYWDGTDSSGNKLPLGVYLLVTGKETKTITILK